VKNGPYNAGPLSKSDPAVLHGSVTNGNFKSTTAYPDVNFSYSVYVPKQYDAKKPAALMVFQDGNAYSGGAFQIPIVFDNLIAKKTMPVTIAVFVNPGNDRRGEYDALTKVYGSFLVKELLPEVTKGLNITKDPDFRGIGGHSSGGICAFTVAWEFPEEFHKVMTASGSFTNILGGNAYPGLIKAAAKKPLRVSLSSSPGDISNEYGSWFEANTNMAAALEAKGYPYIFDSGNGSHNQDHPGALAPATLEWLWADATPL
jgi:enterochelin esterase-like enzyme